MRHAWRFRGQCCDSRALKACSISPQFSLTGHMRHVGDRCVATIRDQVVIQDGSTAIRTPIRDLVSIELDSHTADARTFRDFAVRTAVHSRRVGLLVADDKIANRGRRAVRVRRTTCTNAAATLDRLDDYTTRCVPIGRDALRRHAAQTWLHRRFVGFVYFQPTAPPADIENISLMRDHTFR